MPFRSEAQRRYLWATNPTVAQEFADHTPKGTKLPMHVETKMHERGESPFKKAAEARLEKKSDDRKPMRRAKSGHKKGKC